MKQKHLNSFTSLFLILASVISLLAGCSTPQGTDATNDTNETEVKETVAEKIEEQSISYDMTQRTLTTSLDNIQKYSIQDERIIGVGYLKDSEKKEFSYYLTSWEENWREQWDEKKKILLPFTSSDTIILCKGLDVDEEGNTYILFVDGSDAVSTNNISFLKVDSSGEIVTNNNLKTILPADATIANMVVGGEGKIYLENREENQIYILDREGNYLDTYALEELQIWTTVKASDETVYLATTKKGQLYLNSPQEDIVFQSNEQLVPINNYINVYAGLENHFLITTSNGVLCYKFGDDSVVKMIDWELFGLSPSYLNIESVGMIEEQLTIVIENTLEGQVADIYTFSEAEEKEVITIATLQNSIELRDMVTLYNKEHQDCPIVIKTYLDGYSDSNIYILPTTEEKLDALRKLNTDLVAGTAGDIIDISSIRSLTSIEYYVEQGLIEDIGMWMEQDENIDSSVYIQSVLDATRVDGTLYSLIPYFTLETMIGRASVLKGKTDWTIEDAIEIANQYPDKELYRYQTKTQFLHDVLRYNGTYLIHGEEDTCNLNTESFIKALTYANTLPEEVSYEGIGFKTMLYEGNVLFLDATNQKNLNDGHVITCLDAEMYWTRFMSEVLKQNNDQSVIIGFPTIDESISGGSAFYNSISLAMLSSSKYKERAWEVFQYILSDEYQYSLHGRKIPIHYDAFQKAMELEMTDEGIHVHNGTGSGSGSRTEWFIRFDYVTQEEIDIMNDLVNNTTRFVWENEIIENIIQEEAQYYFAGECTAEQAAQRMQSRVELYLMEKE